MSRKKNNPIRRNSIIWVDLGANKGHIQSGYRPCIVVSCDKANRHAPIYTVIPGTTQYGKRDFPVHFIIKPSDIEGFLKKDTLFLAEQICTIDSNQIISLAGNIICEETIDEVNRIIRKQLELGV
jgi:mRNA interferase MazF